MQIGMRVRMQLRMHFRMQFECVFWASIKMWRIHARLCVQSLVVFPLPRRYRRIRCRCCRCCSVEKSRTKR